MIEGIEPTKTIVGHVDCAGCGQELPLKVNKNDCIYAMCNAVTGEVDGKKERCMSRFSIGRSGTREIVKDYFENIEKELGHVEHEEKSEATGIIDSSGCGEPPTATGARADDDRRGGLSGAINRFLTE